VLSTVHERDDTRGSALTAGSERGGSPVREWCVVVLLRACSLVVKSRSSQLLRHCCVRRPDFAGRVTRLQGSPGPQAKKILFWDFFPQTDGSRVSGFAYELVVRYK
jgi:hypothetical protein